MPPATFRIQPVRLNGITHRCVCRGGNLVARHVLNITCAVERNHLPACHSERTECESRNLLKQQALSCVVFLPTWWIPPLRLRCGRNDNVGTFLRIRQLFLQHFTPPRGPHQARPLGRASFPQGKLFLRVGGPPVKSDGDILGTSPERRTGRSLRFCWRGCFLNRGVPRAAVSVTNYFSAQLPGFLRHLYCILRKTVIRLKPENKQRGVPP